MKFKRLACAAISTAILFTAVSAWDVYDTEYGSEWYEDSKTMVTDDMEQLREKDDPNDLTSLIYTVREDGTAMITDYSGKFYSEDLELEFNIPSEINGHTVTAIGDGALRDSAAKIVGITLPSTIKEIGVNAIYGRYLKYLKLNDRLEVIKDAAINCGDELDTLVIPDSVKYIGKEAISGKALKNITIPTQNRIAIIPTPMLILPVSCDTTLTIVVPTNEAPLPHISISPKYSPDCPAGIILVK